MTDQYSCYKLRAKLLQSSSNHYEMEYNKKTLNKTLENIKVTFYFACMLDVQNFKGMLKMANHKD